MSGKSDAVSAQEASVQGDTTWGVDANGTSNLKGLTRATRERFDKVEASLTVLDQRTLTTENTLTMILQKLEKFESSNSRQRYEAAAEPEGEEAEIYQGNYGVDATKEINEPSTRGTLDEKKVYGGYNSDLNMDESERNFGGSLNIYRSAQHSDRQHTNNESERFVKSIWPEARIACDLKGKGIQVKGLPDGAHKFKVFLDNSWKLVQASDVSIFHKLR